MVIFTVYCKDKINIQETLLSFNHKQTFFSSTDDESILKNNFESVCRELDTLVQLGAENGGLSKKDLLGIYVKGISTNAPVHYAGTELGTQYFFEAILGKNNHSRTLSNHNEYVMTELIYAIARAVSIGNMPTLKLTLTHAPSSTHHSQT